MNIYKLIIVGLGGLIGSIARYVTIRTIDEKFNSIFPYGTLVVNLVGSFILGVVYMLASKKLGMSENLRIFLGAGFCGGLTTFSTFAWENASLLQGKNFGTAGIYILGSVFLGIISVFLGMWTGRSF